MNTIESRGPSHDSLYCAETVESPGQQCLKVLDGTRCVVQLLADSSALAHCHTPSPEFAAKSIKEASGASTQACGRPEENVMPLFSHHVHSLGRAAQSAPVLPLLSLHAAEC